VLNAVGEIPEFAHLKDVILFSQFGERPACDKMSGGDYDGDMYFVSWDPALIPPAVHEPANYEPSKFIPEPGDKHFKLFV
jgi:RNA-dependent RNA polymerase